MLSARFCLALSAAGACALAASAPAALAQAPAAPHPVSLSDLFRFQNVGAPHISPDGKWIAYTVSTTDLKADKRTTDLWMVSWDGSQDVRLTWGSQSAEDTNPLGSSGDPRWSPDGKYLSFLADRPGPAKGTQVWIMDVRGGEAHQLTDVKGELSGYAWSPDATKLVLEITPDENAPGKPAAGDKEKEKPKPIVIDRYHFKEDVEGYLRDNEHTQLWLFDVATHKLDKLTPASDYDETNAVFSPDGSQIAYVSNHDADPDRSINTDVFVVAARPNSTPRQLTHYDGPDEGHIAWSPDGKWIAFLRGDPLNLWQYNESKLGIVAADGSSPARILTATTLDRSVSEPVFSADGKSIDVIVEDDRNQYPASVDIATGAVHREVSETGVADELNERAGHAALVWTSDTQPGELYALDNGSLRKLTHHNDALVSELQLSPSRDIDATTADGTQVHGLLTLPPGAQTGTKYPLLLFIHGGPNGQDAHECEILRQLFAAHGYAVLNVNYRGSSGRGSAYQKAIAGNWGHLEIQDLMASVDQVIKDGLVDPDRMGVGGWSYGGILTDYTIASTNRFKAASSGAGTGDPLAFYGVDEYILQYNYEIGPPWKNTQKYIELGYPFFHADRIHTPTLYMGGTSDMNVPLVGGEQMYEALKTLNVPTELIVYPGQFHGFTRPSFILDRYERWFAWYDKWVLGKTDATPASEAPKPPAGPAAKM